jgi:hypothetical protein
MSSPPIKSAKTPQTDLCFFKQQGAIHSTHHSHLFKQQLHSLMCALQDLCFSLFLHLRSLEKASLSPSQAACELHGGPFMWRSGFSISFSIFMCEVASLSFSIFVCSRTDSASLDDLHLSPAVARGPSRHCFPLRHAPKLPSATIRRRTVHPSFPL